MPVIRLIAARELRSLFHSPLAWSLLGVMQLILAWAFLVQVDGFVQLQPKLANIPEVPGLTELVAVPVFVNAASLLMLFIPLLSMRLLSEEYRSGSFSLLQSAPVSMTQIVLGKYLGLLGFLGLALLLVILLPLSLAMGARLDWGLLAAAFLGLVLMTAAFAAIGLYISSLSRQPAVAAMASYGLLLFLWIIGLASEANPESGQVFQWLSLQHHFQALQKGLVRSEDLIWYLLVILAFVLLCIRVLDTRRRED